MEIIFHLLTLINSKILILLMKIKKIIQVKKGKIIDKKDLIH